jgi:hypothetical protein
LIDNDQKVDNFEDIGVKVNVAGLTDVLIETRQLYPGTYVVAVGQ